MKRLILLLSIFLVCTGCQSSNVQDKKDDENVAEVFRNDSSFQEDASFSNGFIDAETNENINYTYNGEELKIPYFIENMGTKDIVMGIVIFVDGIPQKYSLELNDNKSYIKTVTVKPQDRVNLSLYFSPSTGNKGETKGLFVGTIFNPNFKATVDNPIYGNYHNISFNTPISLNFDKSIDSNVLTTKEYQSEEDHDIDNSDINIDSIHGMLISYRDNHDLPIYYKEDDVFRIPFEMKGGTNCHYKVFAYVDHEVVPIDGLDYLGVTMSESKAFSHEAIINAELVKDSSTFYLVAIVDGDDYTSKYATLTKSDSVLLVNDNK